MGSFLDKLRGKEGKLIIVTYCFPYEASHLNNQVARVAEVGIDYYILETYEKGEKKVRMYPYPCRDIVSIQLNAEIEAIEFQRDEFEYLSQIVKE